jgi:hypothetical protein
MASSAQEMQRLYDSTSVRRPAEVAETNELGARLAALKGFALEMLGRPHEGKGFGWRRHARATA